MELEAQYIGTPQITQPVFNFSIIVSPRDGYT